jgi:hypothetical protein
MKTAAMRGSRSQRRRHLSAANADEGDGTMRSEWATETECVMISLRNQLRLIETDLQENRPVKAYSRLDGVSKNLLFLTKLHQEADAQFTEKAAASQRPELGTAPKTDACA